MRALEAALAAKYGLFDTVQRGHTFLLADGRWTGNLGHHSPAARFALESAGITFDRFDELATFIRLSGAVRTEASHKTLHIQVEGDLTPEQLDAIAAATNIFPRLIYDVYAPDGSDFHTGEGLLDFLDDPLIDEALRRGTNK